MNCTTIDWFSEWPKDALLEVAEKYLEEVNLAEGDGADEVGDDCHHLFSLPPFLFSFFIISFSFLFSLSLSCALSH